MNNGMTENANGTTSKQIAINRQKSIIIIKHCSTCSELLVHQLIFNSFTTDPGTNVVLIAVQAVTNTKKKFTMVNALMACYTTKTRIHINFKRYH